MKNYIITTLPSADVLDRLVRTCGTQAGRRLGDFLDRAIDSFVDSVFDGKSPSSGSPTNHQNNQHQNPRRQW